MSSFFDVDEDETKEKDIVGTTLAPKGTAPPTVDVTSSSSPGFEQIIATGDTFGNHGSRRQGFLQSCSGDLLTKTWVVEGIGSIVLQGKSWRQSS